MVTKGEAGKGQIRMTRYTLKYIKSTKKDPLDGTENSTQFLVIT